MPIPYPTSARAPLPTILYKYYPPERVEALEDQQLRFTAPSEFNDCFDTNFITSPKRAKDHLSIRRKRSNLGIVCLTSDPNGHLMWVNYAARHTGFVVGFKTSDPVFSHGGAILDKVAYSDDGLRVVSDPAEFSLDMAFNKHTAWRYEDEWRCVRSFANGDSRMMLYEWESVETIILGSQMQLHHVSRLLVLAAAIAADGHSVAVCESRPVDHERRFKHVPSLLKVCETCNGTGHR
jgi:hypothetical protein